LKRETVARALAGAAAAALLAYLFLRDEKPPAMPARASFSPPPQAGGQVTRSETIRPLGLLDPARVDILDAYAAAKAAAQEIQPGVELFGVSGGGFVRGTCDLGKTVLADAGPGLPLLFQFEYVGADGGKADVKRHIDVRVEREGLRVTSVEGAVFAREPRGRSLAALDEPTCSSAKAWATAAESGVPQDAEVTLLLRADGARLVWSLWVPGQPLYHRVIDAKTCTLVARPTVVDEASRAPNARDAPPVRASGG
jgi:hypothetical protein